MILRLVVQSFGSLLTPIRQPLPRFGGILGFKRTSSRFAAANLAAANLDSANLDATNLADAQREGVDSEGVLNNCLAVLSLPEICFQVQATMTKRPLRFRAGNRASDQRGGYSPKSSATFDSMDSAQIR